MNLKAELAALNAKMDVLFDMVELLTSEQKKDFDQVGDILKDVLAHEDNRVYYCEEIATALRISKDTVRTLAKAGHLPNVNGIKKIAVTGANLKEYIKSKPKKYSYLLAAERLRELAA